MKIKKVEIQGFRAYKAKKDGTFDFIVNDNVISNFITIYAPNGFGKSSFYDAVEWGVTGNISRYITDSNRRNNEQAAKTTKQEGVPQIILRNKDIDSDITTFVSIETTVANFYKPWIKPRIDSMDLKFNESDTDKNYLFFRNIVLSQDNIDRFIKEVKPENRYKSFIEDFCGDVEFLRRKLTILINENKQKIDDINIKRNIILSELDIPINDTVFDDYNNYVKEINNLGENIPLVSDSFSSNLEHEIISISNRRKIEFEKNVNFLESTKTVFIESKSKIGDFLIKVGDVSRLNNNLSIYNASLVMLNRYQELCSKYSKYSKDLESVVDEIYKIDEIFKNIDNYDEVYENINSRKNEINIKITEKEKLENLIYDLNKNIEIQEVDILNLHKNIHHLEERLYNAESQFLKSKDLNLHILSLEADAVLGNKALDSFNYDKSILDNRINQLINFDIRLDFLVLNNIGIICSETDVINDFYENISKLRNIEHTENAIKDTQSSLSKQMDIAEKMTALGVEYINLNDTSKCPLCQYNHQSSDNLKFLIENNGLLSELTHSNAVRLAEILNEKKNIEEVLNSHLKYFETSKGEKLEELNSILFQLNEKINKKNIDINNIHILLSKAKEEYEDTISATDYMDLSSFVNNMKPKIDQLKNNLLQKQNEVMLSRNNIFKLKLDLKKNNEEIENTTNSISSLSISSPYLKISQYLTEKEINSTTFKSSYKDKVSNFNQTKDNLEKQLTNIFEECSSLREKLIEDKKWMTLEELNNEKEEIENLLYSNNLYINSFCNAIKFNSDHYDYSEIEKYIDFNIDQLDSKINTHCNLISKFEVVLELVSAIKPYSNALKLKEELAVIDYELIKYMSVDKKLSEELGKIISYLSEYIKSFFYTDLINSIYKKIDPHPHFKEVVFEPDFSIVDRPCLNILIKNDRDETISPIIYFSSAQLNILSLSVFLSRAIHAKDNLGNPLNLILIDDPIQAMDSINILSTIDLLRSISLRFDKQIIISTHDENFYRLLQKKVPSYFFNSKFFKLSTYGVVEEQI
jgi:exonuclease SbcC